MESPSIRIEGKTYKAKPPKVKLWRKIVKFNKNFGQVDNLHENIEAYEAMLELLADCFNVEQVTPDAIEDNLDLGELMPTFQDVTTWVGEILQEASKGVPEKN